jgi:methionine-rich copper-binding protein CopC
MKRIATISVAAAIALMLLLVMAGCGGDDTTELTVPDIATTQPEITAPETTTPSFQQEAYEEVKSAHFVSSDPANNSLLTTPVTRVTINFDFNLGTSNTISVARDGTNVVTGPIEVAPDKLSMSVPIDGNATGNYRVDYIASWPDGSQHSGMFGFSVNLP